VGVNVRGRDVESLVNEIKTKLDANLDLPPGYFIRYGGAFENLERASDKLQTVVPVALFLIFILIYFALKSFPQTLMIYLAIPMATIGGVFALWLRDMPFSISAGVGFIVLFGVAVLNGLVMISGLNELKEEGITDLKERIIEGTKRRVRPIMLTAFTDILGFLPMAISASAGAEVQRPLATVVIGGLITSTLLTLFILPIFYQWVEKRAERKKKISPKFVTATAIVCCLFAFTKVEAQQSQTKRDSLPIISLEQAVEISKKNYPLLKTKQLETQKQNALKGTAYDFGNTQVFTGGEEVSDGQGIYTLVGVGQQNINLFGIGAKKRLQKQRIALAETSLDLSGLQVEQEAKKAWSQAYQQRQKYELYRELDSIYSQFEKAIELNFKVEAISRLEYSSATNQALQINNKLLQAESDYAIALQKLNLWLVSDTFYTVPDTLDESEVAVLGIPTSIENHPELELSQKRIDEAEASYKAARSDLLPNLNLQGGLQQVDGSSGFYTYQAGIYVPLFSGTKRSQAKASKIDSEIAKTNADFVKRQLQSEYRQALQAYQKWEASWQFYKNKALPLAKEQRRGALVAYKEGAVDYAAFTQIIRDAIQTEMDALDALDNYLKSVFELQYFKQ
jgi:cobalt-zinc-cadmium resistance protein CzcA